MAAQRSAPAPLPPAWVRPRPTPILTGPHSHRRPGQLRRDAGQLAAPVRRVGVDWGGAAVDAVCRVFRAAGAFIAGLSMGTVVIALVIVVMDAGR